MAKSREKDNKFYLCTGRLGEGGEHDNGSKQLYMSCLGSFLFIYYNTNKSGDTVSWALVLIN